jgi:hypothetical protein
VVRFAAAVGREAVLHFEGVVQGFQSLKEESHEWLGGRGFVVWVGQSRGL